MIKIIDKVLSIILASLMALMVADVTWQVFTRFLTDSPSSWTEEMARFLLIWIGLLGAAWTYRVHGHLGLSYLVEKQSPAAQKNLKLFSFLSSALFAILVLIYGGSNLVSLTLELDQIAPSLGFKIGYVYLVLPISGVLITIYAFDFIRATLAGETLINPNDDDDSLSIASGE